MSNGDSLPNVDTFLNLTPSDHIKNLYELYNKQSTTMKERMEKLTNDTKVRLDDMAADTEDIKSKGKEMAEKLTRIQTDMTKLQAD
ncbi:unnamed protein product, partial [Didymodactylos carnosus]